MNANKICNFTLAASMDLKPLFILCNLLVLIKSLVICLLFHLSILVTFGIYLRKNNGKFRNN